MGTGRERSVRHTHLFSLISRSLYNVVPKMVHKSGLIDKPEEELRQLLRIWLKLNENKQPYKTFRHERYLKEMIRFSRLPDL